MLNRTAVLYGKAMLAMDVSIALVKLLEQTVEVSSNDAAALVVAIGALHKGLLESNTIGVNDEALRIYQSVLALLENEQAAYLALALNDVESFRHYLRSTMEELQLIIVAAQRLELQT